MRVSVVPYDPRWPAAFAAIDAELRRALRGIEVLGIEHVGSTSVPGLPAKPIIDVDVVVTTDRVSAATAALVAAGYEPRGDLGIPDRDAFAAPPTGPARHVYVTVDGSLALRNHLAVRDTLRTNADLRRRYGALKQRLAATDLDDMDAYVGAKSDLLQEILAAAGLSDTERAEIAGVNPDADPDPDTDPDPGLDGQTEATRN